MRRRQNRVFRPALEDRLDSRVLPSGGHVSALVTHADPVPTITGRQYRQALREIDQAFAEYVGNSQGRDLLNGLASDIASTAIDITSGANQGQTQISDPSTNPSPQDDTDRLLNRVVTSVSQLPRGHSEIAPLLKDQVDPWALTYETAPFYRERFKAIVRGYVTSSVRNHTMRLVR